MIEEDLRFFKKKKKEDLDLNPDWCVSFIHFP
jgi:hypothetical protein